LPLKVCKLIHKFWGRIWGQGDQTWEFGVEIEEFPRENQEQGVCSGAARRGEVHSTEPRVIGCSFGNI